MKKQAKDSISRLAYSNLKEYCEENDLLIEKITDRQFRVTDGGIRLDLFPLSNKFHNITTNERGTTDSLVGLVMITFI